ncbi:hypothetical protein PMAYCL1PPCAC_19869 [Pristionchus mayeri]|uniref:Peptidase n=1 Tax=Pristionchus mayeri TaxID=1317129 RepID=A0AAN5CSR6_9BILA|nr:hypothetical protein PMAYCL1PPCAC_19869 [Pristionchus mayeri]
MFSIWFLLLVAGISCQDPSTDRAEWKEWRATVGKDRSYQNANDEEEHALAFEKSLILVKENKLAFEKGEVHYTLALNEFADRTDAELAVLRMDAESVKARKEYISNLKDSVDDDDSTVKDNKLRSSFDWRQYSKAKFPEIEDQGSCGSCYSFSSMFAMEAQLAIFNNITTSLSKQYVLDCTWYVDPKTLLNRGCSGGLDIVTYEWLHANGKGVPETSVYEYTGENRVRSCPATTSGPTYKVKSFRHANNSETLLQENLLRWGPITCGIHASKKFQLYYDGIYHEDNCDSADIDHSVVAIGYGSENGVDFWILRNSWGTNWGQGGYGKLMRGTNECGFPDTTAWPQVTF